MLFLKHQLFIQLQQFKNIDISTQGIYTIQIQLQAESLPEEKSKNVFQHSSIRSSVRQSLITENSSVITTEPFLLKYNNQVIPLKNQCHLFKPSTFDDQEIKITFKLLKIQIDNEKTQGNQNQSLSQIKKVGEHILKGHINQGILKYFQLKSNYPQCSNLSFIICSLPVQLRIGPNKTCLNEKSIKQYRLIIKKYRYFSYIIGKQMHERLNRSTQYTIKLPKQFIRKRNQSTQALEATQQQFQEYLINFDKYQPDSFKIVEELQQIGQNNRKIIDLFYSNTFLGHMSYQKQISGHILTKNKVIQDCVFETSHKLSQQQRQDKFKKIRALLNQQTQKCKEHQTCLKVLQYNTLKPIILVQKQQIVQNRIDSQLNIYQSKPLFIFAHGYQASKKDIRDLKNSFKRVLGRGHYLILSSYTKFMQQNIEKMGIRATNQILGFISQHKLQVKKFKIFMIGHSLGGLILRASLKYLQNYKDNFQTFVSINVPHVGYIKGLSWILKTGLKFHQRMTPSKCIEQLIFKDKPSIQQCYLYNLSKQGSLGTFRNIILISSANDGYVSSQSARIQKIQNPKSNKDHFCNNMVEKIAQGKINQIYRFQIDFDIKEKNIHSFLGRTAHVLMLGNNPAAEILLQYCIQAFTK